MSKTTIACAAAAFFALTPPTLASDIISHARSFDEHDGFDCGDGFDGLRFTEPADGPSHGVGSAFDCDAKADIGMTSIALNCIPVSQETEDHDKT